MLEQCFPPFELEMSWEEFQKLPRHSCYRYSYQNGVAKFTPNLRSYHCTLDLTKVAIESQTADIVSLSEEHWPSLPVLLASALSHLGIDQVREAALANHLDAHRDEKFLIPKACFAIHQQESEELAGAILITRCPVSDLETFEQAESQETPHLTWIAVHPAQQRRGLGEQLLNASATALKELGHRELLSTFLLGNDRATLWHWKMGFELLSHPVAPIREQL